MSKAITNMGNLLDEHDAQLIKVARAISPEQRAEEDRLRKLKFEYETLHTPFETDADRADPEKYPVESDEGEE